MAAVLSDLLNRVFVRCEEQGASDVHLAVGQPPRFRAGGALKPLDDWSEALDAKAVDSVAMELGLSTLPVGCPDGTERVRRTLLEAGALDGAATSAAGVRYRFNLYREAARTAVALRRLDSRFRSLAELNLPAKIMDFSKLSDGLVLVTGPTGSGKSTTLATLINDINVRRDAHVITLEDPVEYIHVSQRSLVSQRQVGRDVKSFNDGLVEALRQDPDVILVGEIRDLATVRTALRAAETGHLVFATLHSGDSAGAVERLISVFPADEQPSARRQLSLVLRGIFTQHLLRLLRGGRVPAVEILVNTSAVANLIATGRSAQLYSAIETGSVYGMLSLDESLALLLKAGKIGEAEAFAVSRNPSSLKARLAKAGFGGSSSR